MEDKRGKKTNLFFNDKSDYYIKGRPRFHEQLFKFLQKQFYLNNDSIVCELGSGTGIFTKQISQFCKTIYAVEPNNEMIKKSKKYCNKKNNIIYINEIAENFTTEKLDFAFAVQSFHYFDKTKLLQSLNKNLKDNGVFGIIWNDMQEKTPINKMWTAIFERQKKVVTGSGDNHNIKSDRDIVFKSYEEFDFTKNVSYSKNKLLCYALSVSFAPKKDDKDYDMFVNKIEKFFDKYAQNGKVALTITSHLQIGKINQITKSKV